MGDQKNKDGDFYSNALLSAAKVGALSGGAGLLYGGAAGVIRSPNPVVHSLSCGIHWFACGSTFWWLRSNIIKLHYQDKASPKERTYVSALCGGVAGGSVTKLMGGRLVPGAIIFSLLGYCGQSVFNRVDAWQMANANNSSKPLVQRMAESKWIPLRTLSDEEYRGMLGEKLLSVEAEIALLDDKIAELEKSRPVLASPAK
ncbi:hypothetical protein N7499_010920 [Penicillium canescens]|uniref:Uncharacterized protein n=1 Tax=Penicillium canescens TaxID=5083 RepID=A0AAD6IJA6_PENCN|nr:hypothetical protein N7522_010612 [Penicillium canescens]KAJ6051577.1 hypothetical protein N7460_002111 [Penicillium canescens]KAJ6065339.1 hypothetical protein N7444_000992 [Penicillium canescens]KAJ6069033.1 hypothetical protein N7499_010920 [Penicillium canescens]KAJ6182912.1 hypothetical protein N7485_001554 [Penicillium canescens]